MKSSLMKLNPVSTFSGEGQGAIVEWVRRILALTYLRISNSTPPILLVMQVFISKFFNPAFHDLISPIDLSFRVRILLFFEECLLIMG